MKPLRKKLKNISPALLSALFSLNCFAAPEEIQVYMDEMNAPGKFGLDLHNNYVISGSSTPGFPGNVPPNHIYRLTPELSYGLTPSFELGGYFLTSHQPNSGVVVDGEKIRLKYIAPKDESQAYFWGWNVEVGKVDASLEPNPWNAEIKGIYGYRSGPWTMAFNLNFDWSLVGQMQTPVGWELDSKVSYAVEENYKLGFESYNELGPVRQPGPLNQFSQTVYAVLDTELSGWNLNFGVGRGFSIFSDRWVAKAIIGVPID